MAHKKGASSSRNGRDSNAQRLGVKRFGGQIVKAGEILSASAVRTSTRESTLAAGAMTPCSPRRPAPSNSASSADARRSTSSLPCSRPTERVIGAKRQ